VIELRISPYGTVRAIDWIEREAYLRGVVPAELGPEIWPQLDALKAQAVAARTYLQANLGQFAREGFDLCAHAALPGLRGGARSSTRSPTRR
jgi:stage II sporulation protein D